MVRKNKTPQKMSRGRHIAKGMCTISLLLGVTPLLNVQAYASPEVAIQKYSGRTRQKITIKGQVLDATGTPITGAFVKVKKNPSIGAATDIDGYFTLSNVEVGTVLEVTFIGMISQEIKVLDNTPLKITLRDDIEILDEVVVVGYGTTSTRKSVGAVSSLKADKIEELPFTNIAQGLQGRTPGLVIQGNSGAPGSTMTVSIRGGSTPLYIIDGVVRNVSSI